VKVAPPPLKLHSCASGEKIRDIKAKQNTFYNKISTSQGLSLGLSYSILTSLLINLSGERKVGLVYHNLPPPGYLK